MSGNVGCARSLESAALAGCLMEGDAEQVIRFSDRRRKTFVAALAIQLVTVAVIVLVPLFATGQRALVATYIPKPLLYGNSRQASLAVRSNVAAGHQTSASNPLRNFFTAPSRMPTRIYFSDDTRPQLAAIRCNACKTGDTTELNSGVGIGGDPGGMPDGILPPSLPVPPPPKAPTIIHRSLMGSAMLIHRVEPVYPPLALMARREGQVQLQAVIGVDGSIESLRVLSGDPLFLESAKAAVLQWRYRPTTLSGQPVEVDTFVTVIFTIGH